jgi:2-polyprenyl-3-methyl-5-hydroxy-6-metoxy-1,4-benzoquinol methylase
MDDPGAEPVDLEQALSFLRALNRRLGGVQPLLRQLALRAETWPAGATIRLLDVGTGSADIPLAVARWAQSTGRSLQVTAVDVHPVTLELARRHLDAAGLGPECIELVQADARQLVDRFEPGAFDYAHASLFLHHLQDIEAMTVLRIMDRLATGAVFVNDLVRGAIGRLGARLATIGAPPMVRHDAVVSVNAGFTRAEILDMAQRVGLSGVRYRRVLGYRFLLSADKETLGDA